MQNIFFKLVITDETSDQEKKAFDQKVFSDEEIANIVDMVLKEDDLNGDGYVSCLSCFYEPACTVSFIVTLSFSK